jgi:dephospho-CoA kinase
MSLAEKRKLADYVVENDCSLEDLEKKVTALVQTILAT